MLEIGKVSLILQDFSDVVFNHSAIKVSTDALKKVEKSYLFLREFSKDKVIYGINTGFGPMAKYKIPDEDQKQLQYNLIRSHCSGSGAPFDELHTKAIMLARMNTLLQGYSGIHPEVVEKLAEYINHGICPLIFEHGGVGASGDLVQLAHLALGLIGEGKCHYKGEIVETKVALEKENVKPIEIHLREGLGIMNGTSAMSGVGAINILYSKSLVSYAVMASAMINEIVSSYDDYYSEGLNRVKKHDGQNKIAALLREVLKDSKCTRKRDEHLYNGKVESGEMDDKVQEYYSLRCVPQILGPVLSSLEYTEHIIQSEVNSVNDNPIIDANEGQVYHGGNFHGDYVSHEMDRLKAVVTKLSMLMERQLNYLVNHKLNEILPPFINLGKLGFNFGIQGIQFTAVSTVAENQSYSFPMCIHSIPNNNDNQDIVSMGTNAALMTKKVIDNTFEVLAIHFMALRQAIEYLKIEDKLSTPTREFFNKINKISPSFVEDSPKYEEIKQLKEFLMNERLNIID